MRRADVGDGRGLVRPSPDPIGRMVHRLWMFASQKDGVSALILQRALEIGSYPTA